MSGHGISTAVSLAADLSNTIYTPLVNWPPGYSVILTPFYILAGQDYLVACFILELLSSIAIIFLSRRILLLMEVSLSVVNLFTLFHGFFIYYFIFTGSTDSLSIAFFLGATALLTKSLKEDKKWYAMSILGGFLLFLSASLKYLYFPVVFTVPLYLFLYSIQRNNLAARKAACILFAITATGIAGLYLYQKSISGTGAYISATGRGFFPEHLLRAHPQLPAAFLTSNTIGMIAGEAKPAVMTALRLLHLMLFAGLSVAAILFLIRGGLRKSGLFINFLLLSFGLIASITLVLSGLSLVVDKELIPPDRWWTYVEDARYYGLADIMIHICVFAGFFYFRKAAQRFWKMLFILLPFLVLPEAIRGFSFTLKRVFRYGKEKYYWQQEREFQRFGSSVIKPIQDSLGVKKLVVTGSLYYANYRTSLYHNAPVLENPVILNDSTSLHTSKPVLLLIMLSEKSLPAFQSFINHPSTRLAGTYNRFYFYTRYVTPG
ncbi:MAG: hypothetical protein ACO25B_05985 [Chitinophagaceae bacterium]